MQIKKRCFLNVNEHLQFVSLPKMYSYWANLSLAIFNKAFKPTLITQEFGFDYDAAQLIICLMVQKWIFFLVNIYVLYLFITVLHFDYNSLIIWTIRYKERNHWWQSQTMEDSFWHKRSAFGQSTAGNDVGATILIRLFRFPLRFLLRCYLFSQKEWSDQKLTSRKLLRTPKIRSRHYSRPRRTFWILQAVSKCPFRRYYFYKNMTYKNIRLRMSKR